MNKSALKTKPIERPIDQESPDHPVAPPMQPSVEKCSFPSATELASVAALLRSESNSDWSRLASVAFDLWKACDNEIQERRSRAYRPFDEFCNKLPQPESYPVPLGKFLELILPKRRIPEREHAYRHFLMDWNKLDLQQAGDLLAEHRKKPASRLDYSQRFLVFGEWLKADLSCIKSESGLKGRGATEKRLREAQTESSAKRQEAIRKAVAKWDCLMWTAMRGMIA